MHSSPALFAWLVATFLVGGIPFGFVVVKILLGKDVRSVGSGNIGATNASRCFPGRSRWVAFAGIYVLDFLKGFLPVFWLVPRVANALDIHWAAPLFALVAVLGHCFSPYLGFKGGKGVATAGGAFFALEPMAVLVAIGVFFVVALSTRVVALGSIALGFALALTVVLRQPATAFGPRVYTTTLAILLAFFLVWTHRSNLRKLLEAKRNRDEAVS
ncbi:MAG: glycerol-3-phosphate 1-O-acyltransferase PlsY [Planctomycetes bacterium]|nr:glycerol-3-phosphate 1-O-acyltransferase PlsY [Planctomycetota bacterium]